MGIDVIIVGSGISGLFSAINIDEKFRVLLMTKDKLIESNSAIAQGGLAVLKNRDDVDGFIEDTLKAGHYKNDLSAVKTLVLSSKKIARDLENLGVNFEKDFDDFKYTKEGGHRTNRILYNEDLTGKEIINKLISKVKLKKNVEIIENAKMIDLIIENNRVYGITLEKQGEVAKVFSKAVILCTGGIGGLFKNSTNKKVITGDSLSIALKYNIQFKDINYIQIHPTALYSKDEKKRRFLITESLRGEGAILLDKNMKRFVNEILPRDVVSKEILKVMKRDKCDYVYLKADFLGRDFLKKRFPNIVKACKEEGYDILNGCIKVSPAQHYLMGGLKVDLDSKTSVENLFACGETSCTGVHGANRLASNSLLEALVFSKRAARFLNNNLGEIEKQRINYPLENNINSEKFLNLIKEECFEIGKWGFEF